MTVDQFIGLEVRDEEDSIETKGMYYMITPLA